VTDNDKKVKPARHTASLSVDFIVVGAGIAGLASAIALRRVGHRVSVLEKHDSITKVRFVLVPSSVTVLMFVALLKGHRRLPYASQSIQDPVSLGIGKGAAEDFVEISGDSFESMSVVWGTFCVLEQLANSPLVETGELLGEHVWDEELLRESRGEFVFAHVRFSDLGPAYYS
jgi:salicylate hydroxylase